MAKTAEHENAWQAEAEVVLKHYALGATNLERVAQGLVNLTVKVSAAGGDQYILQRLNPVFHRSVNRNIDLVTTHIAHQGMLTPRLIRTGRGSIDIEKNDRIWRLLSFVDGKTVGCVDGPRTAYEAGSLLARFHRVLLTFDGELEMVRPPIHDVDRHFERLKKALHENARHPLYGAVGRMADQVHALADAGPEFSVDTARLVHGDPKISNIMFDPISGAALCMIDLDTLSYIPLALELGDALRSWCNPKGEDHPDALFDIGLLDAALKGYGGGAREFLTSTEVAAIVPATLGIHLELAARFLTDALIEAYFDWDPERYASRGAHNLARARGQVSAARSLVSQIGTAERVVSQNMS
jgi:Ser/Thr protein kinase RdoA (MazF antagonist)